MPLFLFICFIYYIIYCYIVVVVNINNSVVIASSTHLWVKLQFVATKSQEAVVRADRIMDHGFLGVLRNNPGPLDWD